MWLDDGGSPPGYPTEAREAIRIVVTGAPWSHPGGAGAVAAGSVGSRQRDAVPPAASFRRPQTWPITAAGLTESGRARAPCAAGRSPSASRLPA
ncbi:hypothetical protein FRAAL1565 [Frankia alni ACN14a]|uniref:Uncharacterized protein n=1 Tax=Frankia alni (strain DSM 45986 / CECT 9034 / ACN14a) TaxID=326424 RepID=Q0RQF5_FRAAA|nr:hypothetical protein FRAAL1565 [Frankia alni ACN14a]